jgi:cation diffusion facilitator family transporter
MSAADDHHADHHLGEHAHHHDRAVVAAAGRAERRTLAVVIITLAMMIAELVVGTITGSLALTADGWHMGTHAGALGLALVAYWFARTRAQSDAFTFGTGKVYALAGYSSGLLLAGVAVWMGVEGVMRLAERPVIDFADALPVAVVGLVVNLASALLLGHAHAPGQGHDHDHDHDQDHAHDHDHDHGHGHKDHNLRAAYVHVLADALTSVLAIVALVLGRWQGWWFLDPLMGVVGGVVIMVWSIGLCRAAARQLLDVVPDVEHEQTVRATLEAIDDVRVADLHVWELGPGQRSCIVSLVTSAPRDVDYYKQAILRAVPVAHLTIEIHQCARGHGPLAAKSATIVA